MWFSYFASISSGLQNQCSRGNFSFVCRCCRPVAELRQIMFTGWEVFCRGDSSGSSLLSDLWEASLPTVSVQKTSSYYNNDLTLVQNCEVASSNINKHINRHINKLTCICTDNVSVRLFLSIYHFPNVFYVVLIRHVSVNTRIQIYYYW